jgi:hypothetical protein
MSRRVEDREDVAELDHAARVHDHHSVGQLRDEPQVVRDEDRRRMRLLLRGAHDLDDLRLDGDVERGRRLVCDEDARLVRDRHRDHRALAHAARELVWVLVVATLGKRHADEVQELDRPLTSRVVAHVVVRENRLGELVADREHGIERRHRVLEDHRRVTASDRAQLLLRHLQEVATFEEGFPRDDAPRRLRDQAEHRHHGDALARARLPDDPEGLAGEEVVGDTGNGVNNAVLGVELHRQIADGEDRLGRAHQLDYRGSPARVLRTDPPLRRVERIPQSVAQQIKTQHRQKNG